MWDRTTPRHNAYAEDCATIALQADIYDDDTHFAPVASAAIGPLGPHAASSVQVRGATSHTRDP